MLKITEESFTIFVILISLIYLLFCHKDKKEKFCVFGIGDCGSQSTTTQTQNVKQNVLNESDFTEVRKSISNNMQSIITNSSSTCSANIVSSQKQGNVITGDVVAKNFDPHYAEQEQKATLHLSCVHLGKIQNELAQTIVKSISDKLENNFDTKTLANLESKASAMAKSGFLPMGKSVANTNTTTNYNLNVSNKIGQTLKNIIINNTNNTFNTNMMQQHLSNLIGEQTQGDIIKGNVNVTNYNPTYAKQIQDVASFMTSVDKDETTTKTINNIKESLMTVAKNVVKSEADVKSSQDSSASSESKGVESVISALTGPFMWIGIVFIIGIVIIGVVFSATGNKVSDVADAYNSTKNGTSNPDT